MEILKPIADVTKPDSRHASFVRFDSTLGTLQALTLEDFYTFVESLKLNEKVPDGVHTQFNTARNLFVYSWFVYGFSPVAVFMAYSALENALLLRTESAGTEKCKKEGLARLLKLAIEKGWICDEGITHHRRLRERRAHETALFGDNRSPEQKGLILNAQDYCRILQKTLSISRNAIAHGHGQVHPPKALILELCADLINQLYPDEGSSPRVESEN